MAAGRRTFVLSFTLPASIRPADVIDWIAQMLTEHSGVRVTIVQTGQKFSVDAPAWAKDTVCSAWRCNSQDWRESGAQLVQ